MLGGHRLLFTERTDSSGRSSILPYLPLILTNGKSSIEFNVCFYRHELAFEVCPIQK